MQPEKYIFPDVPSEISFKPIVEPGAPGEQAARPKPRRRLGTRAARLSLLVALIAGTINWYSGRGDRDPARLAQSQTRAVLSTLAAVETKADGLLEDDFSTAKAAKALTMRIAEPAGMAATGRPAAEPAASAVPAPGATPASTEDPAPAAGPADAPAALAARAQASSPLDAAAPLAEKPVVVEGAPSPPAQDTVSAGVPAPAASPPPQPQQRTAEPVAPPVSASETRPEPPAHSPTAVSRPDTASRRAPAKPVAAEPAPLLGKLPVRQDEGDAAPIPATPQQVIPKAPEQRGVVCFAGCHGLEQRVVYDRPALTLETTAPRPQLQLASLGGASSGRLAEIPRDARRGSCVAGCYGRSRPTRLNRPAVMIPARWEIEPAHWMSYERPQPRRAAARFHIRRRSS